MVATHLTGPPARGQTPRPATVVDLVWAHATPNDRLDHVRVNARAPAGELELAVLLRAPTASAAIRTAEGLFDRALGSPALTGWRSDDINVLPLAALDN